MKQFSELQQKNHWKTKCDWLNKDNCILDWLSRYTWLVDKAFTDPTKSTNKNSTDWLRVFNILHYTYNWPFPYKICETTKSTGNFGWGEGEGGILCFFRETFLYFFCSLKMEIGKSAFHKSRLGWNKENS